MWKISRKSCPLFFSLLSLDSSVFNVSNNKQRLKYLAEDNKKFSAPLNISSKTIWKFMRSKDSVAFVCLFGDRSYIGCLRLRVTRVGSIWSRHTASVAVRIYTRHCILKSLKNLKPANSSPTLIVVLVRHITGECRKSIQGNLRFVVSVWPGGESAYSSPCCIICIMLYQQYS